MKLGLLFVVLIIIVAALLLWFEIAMIIDAIKNPRLSDSEKVLWVVLMFLIHPIVAIVYYFVAHSRVQH